LIVLMILSVLLLLLIHIHSLLVLHGSLSSPLLLEAGLLLLPLLVLHVLLLIVDHGSSGCDSPVLLLLLLLDLAGKRVAATSMRGVSRGSEPSCAHGSLQLEPVVLLLSGMVVLLHIAVVPLLDILLLLRLALECSMGPGMGSIECLTWHAMGHLWPARDDGSINQSGRGSCDRFILHIEQIFRFMIQTAKLFISVGFSPFMEAKLCMPHIAALVQPST
jgi:hypothetical protein